MVVYIYSKEVLWSQTSDNMDRWKAEMGRVREEKRREEKWRSEKRKSQKKEDAGARKSSKIAKHCIFFQWFVAREGRKVGSPKRRVRSHLARWEMKSCTPLWRGAHFQVKSVKLTVSDNFWKLRYCKSARRCGAKQFASEKWGFFSSFNYNHKTTLHYTTLRYATLHYTPLQLQLLLPLPLPLHWPTLNQLH